MGAGGLLGTGSLRGRDPRLLERLRRGEPIVLLDGGALLIQPIVHRDIAAAALACLGRAATHGRAYNVAGPDAITTRRAELGSENLARLCFRAANLATVLLDDGFLPEESQPLEWHQRLVPVRRLLRLEWLAEQLLGQFDDFENFLEAFRAALDPPPPGVVALKSIAAYRTGLDVQATSPEDARSRFTALREQACACRDAACVADVTDALDAWKRQNGDPTSKRELELDLQIGYCLRSATALGPDPWAPAPDALTLYDPYGGGSTTGVTECDDLIREYERFASCNRAMRARYATRSSL